MGKIVHARWENYLPGLKAGSVDMIITDPPHNKTKLSWDYEVDLKAMWAEFYRVVKEDGAIVICATQPFASDVIVSSSRYFRYEIIWNKMKGTTPMLSRKRPMASHENVLVFYRKMPGYNVLYTPGTPYKAPKTGGGRTNKVTGATSDANNFVQQDNPGRRHLVSVWNFSMHCGSKRMPTEKPVELYERFIRMYTKKGDLVVDPMAGSGPLIDACKKTKRKYICVDKSKEQCAMMRARRKGAE